MPRHADYTEWTSETDDANGPARDNLGGFDAENPFDDPEVRHRIAQLIARSVQGAKQSR